MHTCASHTPLAPCWAPEFLFTFMNKGVQGSTKRAACVLHHAYLKALAQSWVRGKAGRTVVVSKIKAA